MKQATNGEIIRFASSGLRFGADSIAFRSSGWLRFPLSTWPILSIESHWLTMLTTAKARLPLMHAVRRML